MSNLGEGVGFVGQNALHRVAIRASEGKSVKLYDLSSSSFGLKARILLRLRGVVMVASKRASRVRGYSVSTHCLAVPSSALAPLPFSSALLPDQRSQKRDFVYRYTSHATTPTEPDLDRSSAPSPCAQPPLVFPPRLVPCFVSRESNPRQRHPIANPRFLPVLKPRKHERAITSCAST